MGKPPYQSAERARKSVRVDGASTDREQEHVLRPVTESGAHVDPGFIAKFSQAKFSQAVKSGALARARVGASESENAPKSRTADIAAWASIKRRHLQGVEFGRLSIDERSRATIALDQFDIIFSNFLDIIYAHIVEAIFARQSKEILDIQAARRASMLIGGIFSSYMQSIHDEAIVSPLRSVSRDFVAIVARYGNVLSGVYEEFIDSKHSQADLPQLSQQERLDLLIDFTLRHNGVGAREFARALFPEREAAGVSESVNGVTITPDNGALPHVAPAQWATDKQPGDTPPAFIQRHYEPWLGKGLARPDIKRLDPQLYVALANWLRNNEMPADLDLPTLKEKNDRWVERVSDGGDLAPEGREMLRVSSVIRARQRQGK